MCIRDSYRATSRPEGLLPVERLHKIAAELSSDVPFFLEPSPCEIMGRGEKIKPLLEYPKFYVIIIKPLLSISTKDAYQNCQPKGDSFFPKVCSIDDLKSHLKNQFETSLLAQYPVLAELKSLLLQNGAFGVLVSGSGSAVFGTYYNKIQQKQAFKDLSCLHIGEIFSCKTLVSHRYY